MGLTMATVPVKKRLVDLAAVATASVRTQWGSLFLGLAFLTATTLVAATSHAQDLPVPIDVAQGAADPWTYVALGVVYLLGQGITLLKAHLEASRASVAERAERASVERDKAVDRLEELRKELADLREERGRLETRALLAEARIADHPTR